MQSTPADSTLEQIHRPTALAKRLGIHKMTIWRMRQRGEFPEPIRISRGAIGWRESQIREWLAARERA